MYFQSGSSHNTIRSDDSGHTDRYIGKKVANQSTGGKMQDNSKPLDEGTISDGAPLRHGSEKPTTKQKGTGDIPLPSWLEQMPEDCGQYPGNNRRPRG